MKKTRMFTLLALALFATLACSVFTGPVESTDSPAPVAENPVAEEPAAEAPAAQAPMEEAPAAEAPSGNILFSDDFSDTNSGWDRNDWDSGITDYNNGTYRMLVKVPSYDIWANPGQYFDGDVRVEADATKVAGELNDDFGLICRYSGEPSAPNYYYFLISSDGYAVIGKVSAGENAYISSEQMQPADAIKQGLTTNHLQADCIGSTMTFYVNGQMVASANDSAFSSGDVGFIAGTFDIPSSEVAFDNLVVSQP